MKIYKIYFLIFFLFSIFISISSAQTYPIKAIKLVVSFPPGGGADITARIVQNKLSENLGVPIIIDNKGGANGILGAEIVAKSQPDGYTILLTDRGALGINPSLYKKLPYNPLTDFEYIGIGSFGPYVLAINSSIPAKTYQEFIAYAKSKPNSLNYASFGVGSMPQLNMEAFCFANDIKIKHIPYRGGGPAVAALLSGEVDATVVTAPAILQFIKDGKIKALVIGSTKRSSLLPNVPSILEVGGQVDTFIQTFFGFAAPAGTPKNIILKLSQEFKKVFTDKEFADKFNELGLFVDGGSSEEMMNTVKSDIPKFAKLITQIGIQPE
jgi:tripartite-type tricarboxylate transporter receptor subunit TctC